MSKSFERNLKIFQKQNPLLALQLRSIQSVEYKKKQPSSMIPQENIEILYCYGVGCYYDDLKEWLHEKKDRKLIFLEDELKYFSFFLKQPETERVLLDPQVTLIALTDPIEEALKEVIWTHLFRPYDCLIMPGKNETFRSHFSELQMNAEMMMCLYRDYGIPQMKNVFANSSCTKEIIDGNSLKGTFEGVPAIICGAGPSLEKNIDCLKTIENQALIFAGGSALSPLIKQEVTVHFGASLDPDPPLHRYREIETLNCPFFYQNQVSSKLLSKVKGPLICMGASGGFPLEKWLVKEVDSFDGGVHVGTFLTHIVTLLGCSPIIFVGMDGCCFGKTLYCSGVDRQDQREDPLMTEDRFGNSVSTRRDFLLGIRWIENFSKNHEQTFFINATEGGLSMSGIKHLSLKEAKETYLTKHVNPQSIWDKVAQSVRPVVPGSQLNILLKSVKKCFSLCEELLVSLEKDINRGTYVDSRYAFQDLELSEEVFFQFVLLPMWDVWHYFLQKEAVIMQMQAPDFEKKIQQTLFYRDLCEKYERIL